MTQSSSESLFRKAAQEEDGMRISAGARLAHLRFGLESGRIIQLDLSTVPSDKRPALIQRIEELVQQVSTKDGSQEAIDSFVDE